MPFLKHSENACTHMRCGHVRNLKLRNFFLHVFIHLYENLHQRKFPAIRYIIAKPVCEDDKGNNSPLIEAVRFDMWNLHVKKKMSIWGPHTSSTGDTRRWGPMHSKFCFVTSIPWILSDSGSHPTCLRCWDEDSKLDELKVINIRMQWTWDFWWEMLVVEWLILCLTPLAVFFIECKYWSKLVYLTVKYVWKVGIE